MFFNICANTYAKINKKKYIPILMMLQCVIFKHNIKVTFLIKSFPCGERIRYYLPNYKKWDKGYIYSFCVHLNKFLFNQSVLEKINSYQKYREENVSKNSVTVKRIIFWTHYFQFSFKKISCIYNRIFLDPIGFSFTLLDRCGIVSSKEREIHLRLSQMFKVTAKVFFFAARFGF